MKSLNLMNFIKYIYFYEIGQASDLNANNKIFIT